MSLLEQTVRRAARTIATAFRLEALVLSIFLMMPADMLLHWLASEAREACSGVDVPVWDRNCELKSSILRLTSSMLLYSSWQLSYIVCTAAMNLYVNSRKAIAEDAMPMALPGSMALAQRGLRLPASQSVDREAGVANRKRNMF